ncbi:hypothetical protein [Paenibacillus albidus]|uniref:hypothetical protein n=1 Tax=Paenibacillus albidus TaxID=2041023 RepID=UPI0035CFDD47
MHHVSGDTKVLLDRLGYWGHLMRLAGKGSMVLTTTMSNGHETGINYLYKVLTSFGSKVIAKYNASTQYPDQLFNEQWMTATTEILSSAILDTLEKGITSDNNLELLFKSLKPLMIYY